MSLFAPSKPGPRAIVAVPCPRMPYRLASVGVNDDVSLSSSKIVAPGQPAPVQLPAAMLLDLVEANDCPCPHIFNHDLPIEHRLQKKRSAEQPADRQLPGSSTLKTAAVQAVGTTPVASRRHPYDDDPLMLLEPFCQPALLVYYISTIKCPKAAKNVSARSAACFCRTCGFLDAPDPAPCISGMHPARRLVLRTPTAPSSRRG